jgi:hypothetical protein
MDEAHGLDSTGFATTHSESKLGEPKPCVSSLA